MKRSLKGILAVALVSMLPSLASASGGYSQTVGLDSVLRAKLGTTSTSYSKSNVSVGTGTTSTSTKTLPTVTLPTKTETITQNYIQPVIQPINQIIQPVVQTVVQPVYQQTVAQPIYLTPQVLSPVYSGNSFVNQGSLISGNPYLSGSYNFGGYGSGFYNAGGYNSGFYSNRSFRNFGGYSNAGYQSYRSGGFFGGGYGFGGNNGFYGRSFQPFYQSYSTGASNSFAFGGSAYQFAGGSLGSVSVNVGSSTATLPGFESLGRPNPGETLQRIFNYNASFLIDGVVYRVDVSSRLTASFATPSASPSGVNSI